MHAAALAAREPLWIASLCLLAFNAVVAVICLVLTPRTWTRLLCAITGHFSTVLVGLGVACGASGLLEVIRMDVSDYIRLYLVLLAEVAALRSSSYYRLRDSSALWWPR